MTKFQTGTMLTSQVMDSQIHAIEKAIRPLFADPVTYHDLLLDHALHKSHPQVFQTLHNTRVHSVTMLIMNSQRSQMINPTDCSRTCSYRRGYVYL